LEGEKGGGQNEGERGSKGDVGLQMDAPRDVSSDVRNPEPNPACSLLGHTLPI
jgi:hypothetical protein